MKVAQDQILTNEAMTGNFNSEVIELDQIFGMSIHCVWTGTPIGNINVQISNDGDNWTTIDTQAAGGAASSKMFNIGDTYYKYARINYAFTGSTGALNAKYFGKGC